MSVYGSRPLLIGFQGLRYAVFLLARKRPSLRPLSLDSESFTRESAFAEWSSSRQ